MLNSLKKTKSTIDKLRDLARFLNFDLKFIPIIIFLSSIVAVLDGLSMGLLIPIINFVFKGGQMGDTRIVRTITRIFPEYMNTDTHLFFFFVASIAFLIVLVNVTRYINGMMVTLRINDLIDTIRQKLFAKIIEAGKLFFDRHSPAKLNTITVQFSQELSYNLTLLSGVFSVIFTMIVYFVIMAFISWPLLLAIVVSIVVVDLFMKKVVGGVKKYSLAGASRGIDLSKKFYDVVSAIPIVKLHGMERDENESFSKLSAKVKDAAVLRAARQKLINPMYELFMMALLVMILVAFWLISKRYPGTDIGKYMVFLLLLKRMSTSLNTITKAKAFWAEIAGPVKEINTILKGRTDMFKVSGGGRKFSGLDRCVQVKDLEFSYIKGQKILDGINFQLNKGETLAIIGHTGCGKSTLLNILMRFYDCPDGAVLLDGIDIKEYSIPSLWRKMAMVSQTAVIFDDTIRKNIVYGSEKYDDSSLWEAIKIAKLDEWVNSLPEGLETTTGSIGSRLSGGERQRIAIARAVFKGGDLFFLDEATSSLDSVTEKLVQSAINDAIIGKTSIIVAHRLSTIRHADKVIVMDTGRVMQEGSVEELLEKPGKFREYWEQQKF